MEWGRVREWILVFNLFGEGMGRAAPRMENLRTEVRIGIGHHNS